MSSMKGRFANQVLLERDLLINCNNLTNETISFSFLPPVERMNTVLVAHSLLFNITNP